MDNCETQIRDLKRKQTEMNQRGIEKKQRIREAERRLLELDSQAGRQNAKLQNASEETFRAWEWLQQHQNEFEKHVFGPPMIECSVNDPKYVNHMEMLVQEGLMLTFTVQTMNDFKKFSYIVHDILHLTEINHKTVSVGLDNFQAPIGADDMKRYGFEGWALDYLNGPERVLAMICGDVRLHETGIGMRDTSHQQLEMLQKSSLGSWVTSKSSYRINRRREYGPSATSTVVRDLKPAKFWTDQPVDLTAKRELLENIEGWTEEVKTLESEMTENKTRILGYRESYTESEREAVCSPISNSEPGDFADEPQESPCVRKKPKAKGYRRI